MGRADVGIGPYEKLHKMWYGGRTQGSLLALYYIFCRAGPVCPAGSAVGRADVGIGPYEKLHKVWWGRRPQDPLLREFAERYV